MYRGSMTVGSAQEDRELIERGWAALPAEYRIPEQAPSLDEARAYCQRLATTHYENFHVASWFLPERLRPHFYSIYAYCRIADDLGDEVGNREQSLALLDLWGRELDACYQGEARHPVFVALAETIRACDIPKQPFADLLVAFRQDQNVARYKTMDDVLEYCRYSANPVGRLVLYACGYRTPEMFLLSDFTCTALQLANFWQDVSSDYVRGRIYLPLDDMQRYGVDENTIARREPTAAFRELMRHEVDYARQLFEKGLPLIGLVDRELALDLDLFSRGGLEILHAIELRHYDVLSMRPVISKSRKLGLAARAVWGKFVPRRST
jgi:squalene synthase HpnC